MLEKQTYTKVYYVLSKTKSTYAQLFKAAYDAPQSESHEVSYGPNVV